MPRPFHRTRPSPAPVSAATIRNVLDLAALFRHALAAGDFAEGARLSRQALDLVPNHMGALSDHAFCLLRLHRYEAAHAIYRRIWRAPPALQQQASATWLDGLTEVCGWLGRFEDVRRYGHASLTRADARFGTADAAGLRAMPPPFDATDPRRNVIAYSLFGANPRYCETMVRNAEVAPDLFPHWTCRVYLDDSVPHHVRRRLQAARAEVIDVADTPHRDIHPLMWRFLVLDDPAVQRFLVRDADSLLSEREQAAVQEWLGSPFWFHHMRDYFTHTELILAGMWGGCAGAIVDVATSIRQFMQRAHDAGRFADQHFLREFLWPLVRHSVLNHDELFGFHGARPFPAHARIRWNTPHFHVGSNVGYSKVGASGVSKADGETQRWALTSARGDRLGEYESIVSGGAWSSNLPFFHAAAIDAGELRVELL